MRTGYVYLETHPDHPGMIRLLCSEERPEPGMASDGGYVRYVARFNDMDAGEMHAHTTLRRSLVDINTHLYRASLPDAMAAIEADDLNHQREWIDPNLDPTELERVEDRSEVLRERHRRSEMMWRIVGVIGIILLIVYGTIL